MMSSGVQGLRTTFIFLELDKRLSPERFTRVGIRPGGATRTATFFRLTNAFDDFLTVAFLVTMSLLLPGQLSYGLQAPVLKQQVNPLQKIVMHSPALDLPTLLLEEQVAQLVEDGERQVKRLPYDLTFRLQCLRRIARGCLLRHPRFASPPFSRAGRPTRRLGLGRGDQRV